MFDSQQLHRLRKLTGKKDVWVDGHLYAEGINGSQESIVIKVPHPTTQIKVEVREHGRPYRKAKMSDPVENDDPCAEPEAAPLTEPQGKDGEPELPAEPAAE